MRDEERETKHLQHLGGTARRPLLMLIVWKGVVVCDAKLLHDLSMLSAENVQIALETCWSQIERSQPSRLSLLRPSVCPQNYRQLLRHCN